MVDKFRKMYVPMHYKRTISETEAINLYLGQFWVHFGIPRSIILDRDTTFLSEFLNTLREKMEQELKRSTIVHPQKDGKT